MKKRLVSILLCCTFAVSAAPMCRTEAEEDNSKQLIWVSPSGNDINPGTKERPLKTPQAAKKRAGELLKTSEKGVEVLFREGEYRFAESLKFTAADSGKDDSPVVYKAYNGEKVEFKGSVQIDSSKGQYVTDEKVLSRLYDSVRTKVVCFDLKNFGFTSSMVRQPAVEDGPHALRNGEVNGVYINGETQTVAEWPNGEGIYRRWEDAVNATTIKYTDTQPDRWTTAKDFWIGGYPSYDYYYIRQSVTGLDSDEKTISIYSSIPMHQFTSHQSRRWKAINLLEEIDVPGEYYIDTDNLLLYIYPTSSLKDAKMEISWLSEPLISVQNAKNIRFEGIDFSQTRGNGVTMVNVDNVDFADCRFDEILSHAIYVYGTAKAQTDKDYWQVQDIDASYNCDVTGCIFNNIGGGAIHMSGGNVDTLKKSNNVISDNMIYHANYLAKNQCAVLLKGCGTTVVHNNISKCPFMAIRHYGNDHTISYNEIYNVDQESDDCGAIYAGRNVLQRGTEISYNYLHDLFTTEKLPFGFQSAIYWDDAQTGLSAHHNIIKNARIDLASNGSSDFDFSENISVNIEQEAQKFINGGFSVNNDAGDAATNYKFGSFILNPELYYSRYKNLKELLSFDRCDDPKIAKFNIIQNNLTVNATAMGIASNTEKYGTIKGNLRVEQCDDFVNPQGEDYRIKSGSKTAKRVHGILTDEFDIEQIGLQNNIELNEKTAPFCQIYPQNGADAVRGTNLEFKWGRAFGATNYRLVVAEDENLQNKVYDEIVPYTLQKVEGLEGNKVYYWKVYAMNQSRDLMSSWGSSGCVYSFKTALYDRIDTKSLDAELKKIGEKAAVIDEGENVGQYPPGTRDKINSMMQKARILKKSKLGILRQTAIDAMAKSLSGSLSKIGMVNKGFLDITDYINDKNDWRGPLDISGDGTVSISGVAEKTKVGGTTTLSPTTGSCLYSFDAKVDTQVYAIIGFARHTDMVPYSAANTGYSICIKDDLVELQLSTGTSHDVVYTINKSFANDGKYHHLEFGFVDIDIGNLVALYVDGEAWIEYPDIFGTSVNNICELSMFVTAREGEKISIRPATQTSDEKEFEDFIRRNLYSAVKLVMEKFDTTDEVVLFKEGSTKIFSPKGVFDVSYAPNKTIGGKLMIAFDKVDDIFGVQTNEKDGNCYVGNIRVNDTAMQNGYAMVSAEEVLKILGRASVRSTAHEMLIAGNIIYMNNVDCLNKAQELMKFLEKYNTDYLF